ncbi:Dos2-interacting transcription regulator of RNA-Pol-II-domain-containing protein [Halteromyces radiatus]|uniref:Dos2-interacting transcription regulator of RNA-Pol-II-domain-containing protein n=1 Tax=Halteromyces radiatus TaxID=101107 RepID=UPI00221EAC82|nr:Dos2-interacting transcription regulator of RNA-Pol-II-domain-containing protein [Halteromyces radiatus]KAI8089742.1 Dos2-interacting transcription regulator of RNA-Pol-II-domain-containing protein [Halteromyces radiatus]
MEVDCKVVLDQWLTCPEQKVLPSFLASILLFVNKTPNGIEVLLHLLDQYWNPSSGTVIFEDSITISDIRVKCIDLLAQTITPSISFLKPATVNTILQFMDGKLVEPLTVSRFIDIISVLVEHDLCTTQHCMTICNQLFSYIPGKKWNQPTRFKIFTILGHLLQKYYKDINRSSMNFIDGFISIMDGEKDPRNLLLVFDLIRFVIEKLDISRHVENIFDVVFCYFPISFTTPPNDPLAITSDQLKHSLRLCLAASPYFAYFATPLLIEKLVSSSGSAKKDTMDTIRMCAPSYGAHALLPHAQDLFGALVKEVYQSSDLAMKSIALETIHQVVATLATGISIVNIRDPVERAIEDLLHQAVENLKQPELKNARSASLILRSAASASDPACTLVVNAVLPLLYHEHKVTDMVSRQKAILGILIDILEASNSLYGSINSTTQDRDLQTPLTLYKQQLLQIFVTSLINERHYSFDHQLRYQSLLGIRLMVIMKRFLSMEEVDVTVAHLTRQALDNDKDIRNLVLSTLAIVSIQAPDSLIRHTLPYLLENLEASHQDENKFEEILIAIQTLTVEPVLVCAVTKPLLSKMSAACRRSDAIDSAYTRALAKTLYQILDQTKITPQVLHVNQTIIFPTIVTETVKASLNVVDPHNCWHLNSSLLSILALILAVIVRSSSSNDQEQMVAKAFNLFINDTSGQVVSHHLFGTCVASNDDEDRCEKDMTIFFPAILGNCWKEVRLPLSNVKLFLKNLILHSTEVTCETRRLSLVKTAAVIINKWVNSKGIH